MSRQERLRRIRAIYDPEPRIVYDPDPDPFPWTLLIFIVMAIMGAATWTNPNLWNNFLYTINPALKAAAEEDRKAMQQMLNTIAYGISIIGLIGLLIFAWERSGHKKVRRRYL